MKEELGYCKECGEIITEGCCIEDLDVWECPNCGHPHSRGKIWEELPDYLIAYREKHNLPIKTIDRN